MTAYLAIEKRIKTSDDHALTSNSHCFVLFCDLRHSRFERVVIQFFSSNREAFLELPCALFSAGLENGGGISPIYFLSHAFFCIPLPVMPLLGMGSWMLAPSHSSTNHGPLARLIVLFALLLSSWLGVVEAMRPSRVAELRQETVDMFYHGFDNYMEIAFPEDEVCID